MLDRRQVLVAGLALPCLLVARTASAVGRRGTVPLPPPLVVLVDRRHVASRAFGAAFAALGVRIVDCTGDVSRAWRLLLGPLEQAGTGTVAGLTSPATLLCLERIALAQGLRVAVRAPSSGADPGWRYDAAGLAAAPLVHWQIAAGPSA